MKHTIYIVYLNLNNLYGWAMSQLLPEGGFRYLLDLDCWDAQRIHDLARHDHAGYVQVFP